MNILYITGSSGAGKSTAIACMKAKLGGTVLTLERGGMVEMRERINQISNLDRLYIDCETPPSPAFLSFAKQVCTNNGVKHLVIAHTA